MSRKKPSDEQVVEPVAAELEVPASAVPADGAGPDPLAGHTPVVAPEPEPGPEPLAAQIAPEPTPTVTASEASWSRPVGSAAPDPASAPPAGDAAADRPEVLVGAAFAGGLVFAMMLKRLGR